MKCIRYDEQCKLFRAEWVIKILIQLQRGANVSRSDYHIAVINLCSCGTFRWYSQIGPLMANSWPGAER